MCSLLYFISSARFSGGIRHLSDTKNICIILPHCLINLRKMAFLQWKRFDFFDSPEEADVSLSLIHISEPTRPY